MNSRTVRSVDTAEEPPSPNPLVPYAGVAVIVALCLYSCSQWAIPAISRERAASVASRDRQADEEAVERVEDRHLIPSPTPEVVQVEDPALVAQVKQLSDTVGSLK